MNDVSTNAPVLELEDVAFKFRRAYLFQGVRLTVRPGEFHVLMGENGAGKTTLLHCLLGLRRPARGKIAFFGKPAQDWDTRELHRLVGIVVAAPEAYAWRLSVGELLRETARFYPTWDHAFAGRLADEFQIGLAKKLQHLSSGEHAKVRLLKALAFKPRLLLLDELTANLSPRSAAAVTRAVIDLMTEQGTAALYISHGVEETRRLSDHVHRLGPNGLESAEVVA